MRYQLTLALAFTTFSGLCADTHTLTAETCAFIRWHDAESINRLTIVQRSTTRLALDQKANGLGVNLRRISEGNKNIIRSDTFVYAIDPQSIQYETRQTALKTTEKGYEETLPMLCTSISGIAKKN